METGGNAQHRKINKLPILNTISIQTIKH